VINSVYKGIQFIHASEAIPDLYFNGNSLESPSCGLLTSSSYCFPDNIIFIPSRDISWAYQHGDAALAYIVAHEYAHAMQDVYNFQIVRVTSELQADCFAGLYLGLIPNIVFDTSDMLEIGFLAHRFGQPEHHTNRSHGTPKERIEAVSIGMDASSEGLMGGMRICLNQYSTQ